MKLELDNLCSGDRFKGAVCPTGVVCSVKKFRFLLRFVTKPM